MQDVLTIRPTTGADIAEVDALLAQSYPRLLKADYPPSVLVTALPLISRAQPGLVRSGTYFAALRAGRIVGAGGWTLQGGPARVAAVRHVVTDAGLVRQGIATRLFHHIFATARGAGAQAMDCLSTRTAVGFYRSVGFDDLGEVVMELRPGISLPVVRMHRLL